MTRTEYCPHTSTCPFYEEFNKKTRDKRKDVIFPDSLNTGETQYRCLALTYSMTEALRSEGMGRMRKQDCSHITLLNLLSAIQRDK